MSRRLGKVSYQKHTGEILDDGVSIRDNKTGRTFPSSTGWIVWLDQIDGRVSPMEHRQKTSRNTRKADQPTTILQFMLEMPVAPEHAYEPILDETDIIDE